MGGFAFATHIVGAVDLKRDGHDVVKLALARGVLDRAHSEVVGHNVARALDDDLRQKKRTEHQTGGPWRALAAKDLSPEPSRPLLTQFTLFISTLDNA